MTDKTGQEKASSQSQKSLEVDVKMGNQVGVYLKKTSNQEAEHVGPFLFPRLDMGSPWLLKGSLGWDQDQRPVVFRVWRP